MIRKNVSIMSNLRKNKKGSIEGLPLQLIIIILVATLGTAIIVGWMGSVETPDRIGDVAVDSGDVVLNNRTTNNGYIKIAVTDQNGDALEGATVVLSGCNVVTYDGKTVHGTTDGSGIAEFKNLKISLKGTNIGFITADVSKSGYGNDSTAKVAVIG